MFTSESSEKTGEKRNQGDTDEGNTAARNELLDALRFSTGVVLTVTFKEVDTAPYAERTAESNNKSLESFDCSVEEFHIISPLFGRSKYAAYAAFHNKKFVVVLIEWWLIYMEVGISANRGA